MTFIPYLFQPGKAPSERRSFGFDFSNAPEFHRHGIVPPQIIEAYTISCDDPDLTIETPILSGHPVNPLILSAYINGGLSGTTYTVVYQVTTDVGSVIQRSVLLPVNDL